MWNIFSGVAWPVVSSCTLFLIACSVLAGTLIGLAAPGGMPSVKVDSSRSPIPLWRTIRDEPPFAVVLPFELLDQDDHRRRVEVDEDPAQPEGAFELRSTAFAGPAITYDIGHHELDVVTQLNEVPGPQSQTGS